MGITVSDFREIFRRENRNAPSSRTIEKTAYTRSTL